MSGKETEWERVQAQREIDECRYNRPTRDESIMTDKHFSGKVAVKVLLVRDGRLLIIRDAKDAEIWELPGGRLNEGEQPQDAARRECLEELGVDVSLSRLVYAETFVHSREQKCHLLLAYEARMQPSNQEILVPSKEIAEAKWVNSDEVNEYRMYDNCRRAVTAFFRNDVG